MLNVAENLKRMRIDSGTEKKQLATFFNITEGTYSRWENGTRVPDLFNLVRLSEYFGCTLEDLVLDHSDDNLVSRDLVLSYRDLADKGYNGSLAHGLIKEVLSRSTYENVPVVSHDKKLYSYREALDQPNWVRSFGSLYTFTSAFKFSRIVYTVLVFVPTFIFLMFLPFISWNYSLILSFVIGLSIAYAIEDLKIDGRPFIFFFKDYLIYYFTYGYRVNEIYINKGKIYRRYDKKGEK